MNYLKRKKNLDEKAVLFVNIIPQLSSPNTVFSVCTEWSKFVKGHLTSFFWETEWTKMDLRIPNVDFILILHIVTLKPNNVVEKIIPVYLSHLNK